ncbi:DUF5995 family protein [Frankia sp. CiP3]|uniref:DUF5995 family protein n=1 Tax=Frankia sp. CiP3 TaxID=2880971 RepID=UPI001EF5F2DC|nr:DUF5995 family protein [Frankia sp. CiP3]
MKQLVWGTVQQEITNIVADSPSDVSDVVAQLGELKVMLQKATPENEQNPIADFNHLYWTITSMILERLRQGDFQDPVFLTLLDVEFAKRYFNALRLWGESDPDTPEAWKVLFRRLNDRSVHALPAAVAGVNAHVNFDLPFALLSTWKALGSGPSKEAQHQDYLLINQVFFEAIPGLRRSYLKTWQLFIDRLNGRLDDWYEDRIVEFTRNLAWTEAERLWSIRDDVEALRRLGNSLDRHTAFIGCALLSPIGALLQ